MNGDAPLESIRSSINSKGLIENPTYNIPNSRIVSIEHPCIVRDFEKGFKSLGKEPHLKHVLDHTVGETRRGSTKRTNEPSSKNEPVAGVSLRPDDTFANRLTSVGVDTRNVLVKVTLPKRTGRKRKRRSDAPFTALEEAAKPNDSITASELLQRMRDNKDRLTTEPVGFIKETHRFRSLPDFQLQHGEIPAMQEIKRYILPPSYDSLSKFNIDMTPGPKDTPNFPAPPNFITTEQPYAYNYQSSAFVRYDVDEAGQPTTSVHMSSKPRLTSNVDADVREVPQRPPDGISYGTRRHLLEPVVHRIAAKLEEQPIITRRHLRNTMPEYNEGLIREATEYVAYNFKSGPWRDTAIKYGIDPRSDPKYRFYQTVSFQMDKGRSAASHPGKYRLKHDDLDSHLFDGTKASSENKTFQLCDISEPLLTGLINTVDIRSEVDPYMWGWYGNGTMTKLRIIMREKISSLLMDKQPQDAALEKLAELPNYIDSTTVKDTYPEGRSSKLMMRLTAAVRGAAFHNVNKEDDIKAKIARRPASIRKKGRSTTRNNNNVIGNLEDTVVDSANVDEEEDPGDDDDDDDDDDDVSIECEDEEGEDGGNDDDVDVDENADAEGYEDDYGDAEDDEGDEVDGDDDEQDEQDNEVESDTKEREILSMPHEGSEAGKMDSQAK